MGLVVKQKHTQWPGPGRTNHNVVGVRMFPRFAVKARRLLHDRLRRDRAAGGLFQINPIWLFGPYEAAVVSAAQPARLVRHVPRRLDPAHARPGRSAISRRRYTIPPLFWPTVVLPGILTMLPMVYPFIEARLTKDQAHHNLLQRPRDVPARTALGAMAIAFYWCC